MVKMNRLLKGKGISLKNMLMAFALSCSLLAAGCSKVTQDNYAKIKVGMKYAEVTLILGEPASCSSVFNVTNCVWGNASRSIDVSLVADKVVFLSSKGL